MYLQQSISKGHLADFTVDTLSSLTHEIFGHQVMKVRLRMDVTQVLGQYNIIELKTRDIVFYSI